MFKIFLTLHLLSAIFAIGPLAHAATTAGRWVRRGDASAAGESARVLKVYSYASVIVVAFGFALMSSKSSNSGEATAQFGETWIWLSTVLWLAAVGLILGVLVPQLEQAANPGGSEVSGSAEVGFVAGAGGAVGLIFAGIVLLMVYQPGG